MANIIEHGYEEGTTPGQIDINLLRTENRIEVTIRDESEAFDPTVVENPDLMEHIRAGHKKGLGMFIIRKIMDEISHSFEGHNVLRMVKFIGTDPVGD